MDSQDLDLSSRWLSGRPKEQTRGRTKGERGMGMRERMTRERPTGHERY